MAEKKKSVSKKEVETNKNANPVGRPKKKYGAETLLNNKKSFKLDSNIVLDKYGDALIVAAVMLIAA